MEENLKVVFIKFVGENTDKENIYHLLISEDSDKTWGEGWENKPACVMRDLTPPDNMYEYVAEIKTDCKLDLATENCCCSMQDCRDNIVPLAYENLDEAEEYPEEGRIVIHFGDSVVKTQEILAKRNITLTYI